MTRAWHFIRADRRLGYGDGREVRVGETLQHEGPLELCRSGLHASVRAIDALWYAPGPVACRVECGGEIIHGGDKLVASERTVIGMVDATDTLRHFARMCALDVIHLWDAPDVVLRHLRTGDGSLRAVAGAAAGAAARAAAWAAAGAAARAAAWAAAGAAARDAARDAAGAAARGAQNRRLHRMLMRAIREAA